VTIRDYTYRSTVATVNGQFMVGVSAENRAKAGVAGGDEVNVDIELDTEPRTVEVPADLRGGSRGRAEGAGVLRWAVEQPEIVVRRRDRGAKTSETRQRRIDGALERLREGRGQR
jgi:hypothetical protein